MLPYPHSSSPAICPAEWKPLRLLALFLQAAKTQLLGREEKLARPLPKGMEEALNVLGSIADTFLAPEFHTRLSEEPPSEPQHRCTPIPPNFREAVEKLPPKPTREPLLKAAERNQLMCMRDLACFLSSFSANVEATDTAVRRLLNILAKSEIVHPDDVTEYLILITIQFKQADLNSALVFVPLLVKDGHVECDAKGEVHLKRRNFAPPVLPPHPCTLNLRLAGDLLGRLAQLPSLPPNLNLSLSKELVRVFVPPRNLCPPSTAVVSLSVLSAFLELDVGGEGAKISAAIRERLFNLSLDSSVPMSREDVSMALYHLCRGVSVSAAQFTDVTERMELDGCLGKESRAELLKQWASRSEVWPLMALGSLGEMVEKEGEFESLRRREGTAECILAEPPLSSTKGPPLHIGLDVLITYVETLRAEKLGLGRSGLSKDDVERLEPIVSGLPNPMACSKATAVLALRGSSSAELTSLLNTAFPEAKLNKADVLPALLRLKAQKHLNVTQLTTVYQKAPYPISFPTLRLILEKVLSWTMPPPKPPTPTTEPH